MPPFAAFVVISGLQIPFNPVVFGDASILLELLDRKSSGWLQA